ncbi:MAG: glycosyltransferase family 4 protein [Acidobacteriia bacterium]|nr:glycosyltransferase family 4 protein [Terriglobia bacterium]
MRPAKILVLHNRYQQAGGEDGVYAHEVQLLRRNGHQVIEYLENNEGLDETNAFRSGLAAIWSCDTTARLRKVLHQERPDIAHFHNTFARISPAAYYACRQAGVPVVQTLHNFRIGCLNAFCMTEGNLCERCLPHLIPVAGIVKGCYRGSSVTSAGMAAITITHKILGTYRKQVDAYIALTEFARRVHLRAGVPADKTFVKPNFIDHRAEPPSDRQRYALFASRLCPEKGVLTMLQAWKQNGLDITLKIAGDGPSAPEVAEAAAQYPNIEWLGSRSQDQVMELMRHARFLVMPSLGYENFPLCLVEAFSAGLPCLASGHGAMQEIVDDGLTGLHFQTGDAADLAAKARWMAAHPAECQQMGLAARERFSERYTPERNYQILTKIYDSAMSNFRISRSCERRPALTDGFKACSYEDL